MANDALANESVRTRFVGAFSIAHRSGADPSPGHEQVQQCMATKFDESRRHNSLASLIHYSYVDV